MENQSFDEGLLRSLGLGGQFRPSWVLGLEYLDEKPWIPWLRSSWLLGQDLGSLGEGLLGSFAKAFDYLMKVFLAPWPRPWNSW